MIFLSSKNYQCVPLLLRMHDIICYIRRHIRLNYSEYYRRILRRQKYVPKVIVEPPEILITRLRKHSVRESFICASVNLRDIDMYNRTVKFCLAEMKEKHEEIVAPMKGQLIRSLFLGFAPLSTASDVFFIGISAKVVHHCSAPF